MRAYLVIHLIAALLLAVFLVSAIQAQTCNPNIPLKTPDNVFIDNANGTVTHQPTGLMWKKCLEGQSGVDCTGAGVTMTWSEVLIQASSHEYAGHSDWRLPNIKELASIVETACSVPAINLSIFPNDPGSMVWSASPNAYYSGNAWSLHFNIGNVTHNNKGYDNYVRLVRGGP